MEKLKLYMVTKSNSSKTITVGDIIWISQNGDLNSAREKGWLSEKEWNVKGINDFEVKECEKYYLDVYNGRESIRPK